LGGRLRVEAAEGDHFAFQFHAIRHSPGGAGFLAGLAEHFSSQLFGIEPAVGDDFRFEGCPPEHRGI
jgi:hypothetical protein